MSEENKEDVKTEVTETSAETKEDVKTESSTETKEDEFDFESDENRNIPYARFKKVNDKRKDVERKLKTFEAQMDVKVQDGVYRKEMELRRDYEDRLLSANKTNTDDFSYDDQNSVGTTREMDTLKQELSEIKKTLNDVSTQSERDRIKTTVSSLKDIYPELDEEHVYAMKRARPEWAWEDCAEYSHKKFSTHLQNKWKEMVENKKKAALKKVTGSEGIRNLKPEDKPKTFKEAREMAARVYGDN